MFIAEADREVITHNAGVAYQYDAESVQWTAGLGLQHERLLFEQTLPRGFDARPAYFSILPSSRIRIDLSGRSNLNFRYRASTDVPSARQLTDVVDESNPLLISTGNPSLEPSLSHQLRTLFRSVQPESRRVLFTFISLEHERNHIASATTIAGSDSLQTRGVVLHPGGQLSYPVNLDGYWNLRSTVSIGRPVGFLQSNVNARLGAGFSRSPGRVNSASTRTDAIQAGGRLFLGSNISEEIDFSVSYGLTYTNAWSTSVHQDTQDRLRHRSGVDITLLPGLGLVFRTEAHLSHYTGLKDPVDPTTIRLDLGLGYKFLKRDRAEANLRLNDALNQERDITQDVTDRYVEDRYTNVLGRHLLLKLTYKMRRFN